MPDDLLRPSYEVLAALVVSLRGELIGTRAELERAVTRIAELEARLAANSGNSSKPPSSDGLAKSAPKPRSLRKKTDRKPGGQHGHAGTTLRQVAKPKHEVAHEPGPCTGCGCSLSGRPITAVERRQQFDLPPICIEVTEHQLVERECVCGRRTRGEAPAGADAPVQYGPRIAAIVVYLYVGQFLSKKRTAQALAELFGTPLSGGTVLFRWFLWGYHAPDLRLLASPGSADRTITLAGATKSHNIAGIGGGFAFSPNVDLIEDLRQRVGYRLGSARAIQQVALVAAYKEDSPWLLATRDAIRQARDRLGAQLGPCAPYVPRGTYFYWLDLASLGVVHAADHLRARCKVAGLPGSDFGAPDTRVRLAYATESATIDEVVARLRSGLI